MFLGANGTTLRGQKAVLGVATIRGRTDYMLPDANNITFHVSRSELINNASRATTSTTNSKSSENTDKSIVLNSSEGIVDPHESSRNSDTAPTTDVMQTTISDPEKDTSSTTGGKGRKNETAPATSTKKRYISATKQD
ncbi:hypothetical protein ACQ4PT_070237 [Festuca glaucescens]